MVGLLIFLFGVAVTFYFYKRYMKKKPVDVKLVEFLFDLVTGTTLFGPILMAIGIIAALIEFKILK